MFFLCVLSSPADSRALERSLIDLIRKDIYKKLLLCIFGRATNKDKLQDLPPEVR